MKRNIKGQFINVPPEKRFWDKVKKTTTCWNWIGAVNGDGYGVLGINGLNYRAHRFVLKILGKKVPKHLCVCHHCDNILCVNPNHLFIGTQHDNMKDMLSKKRNIYFGTKGADNPQAKLTKKQILEIRKKYIPYRYTTQKLAYQYHVAQQTISRIINKQRYANC